MFQKLVFVGNLGRDPEMRYTANDYAVTNLSVAANRRYTKKDGTQVDETTWYRVSVWGKQAEACTKYLVKGNLVLVEGRLIPNESGNPKIWHSNSGEARASFDVNATNVKFLTPKNNGSSGSPQQVKEPVSEADIPF